MSEPCVVCGGTESRVFLDGLKDFEYGADWTGRAVVCQGCGTVQQAPMLSVEEALSYYPSSYVHYVPEPSGLRTRLMRLYLRPVIKRLRQAGCKPGMRLLDVGCGGGLKASILRDTLGLDVVGIEPNPKAAETARQLFGLEVLDGTIPHPDLAPQSFDYVFISHVIEHLPDPVAFLNALYDLLAPGGVLLGETENIDCLSFRLFKRYWSFLHVPYHLLFFKPESLRFAFGRTPFADVRIKTQADPMAWSLSLQNYLRRKRQVRDAGSTRMPGYLLLSLACVPVSWIEARRGPVLQFSGVKSPAVAAA